MAPSVMASHPGSEVVKQPQTITLPPLCLTVGMMFLLWSALLALWQMLGPLRIIINIRLNLDCKAAQ